jgi:hypothetical protein
MNAIETAIHGFATGFACMAVVVLARTIVVGVIEIICHTAIEKMQPKDKPTV